MFLVVMVPPALLACVEKNHEALASAGMVHTSRAVAKVFFNMH
jgi:hypothetical protein